MAKQPEKSAELLAVEAEHDFVFGGGDKPAPGSLSVVCRNPDCDRVNRATMLHPDTVLPVSCGGCGQIIHCDHPTVETVTHHEGDLSTPRRVTREVCTTCRAEMSRTVDTLDSIPFDKIPLHLLGGVDLGAIVEATR